MVAGECRSHGVDWRERVPVSEATYERVVLEDSDTQWELVCGRLREKPTMTAEHQQMQVRLIRRFVLTLDEALYDVRPASRVRLPSGTTYVPDLIVVPRTAVDRLLATPGTLDRYDEPLPLVVEVWSPSTGSYDARTKLPEYQARGDLEIWFIHPYDKTLTAWRRQPDGAYLESVRRGGTVSPAFLPNATIDRDALFA